MEKFIQDAIKSFSKDLDPRKLEILDKLLLFALLKKEALEINADSSRELHRLRQLCDKYSAYRDLMYSDLSKNNRFNDELLRSKLYPAPARLILLLTHSCQLRCAYCRVRKFSGSMTPDVLKKAVRLLFTSNRDDLQLQFFGGEPLLRFDLVKTAVACARSVNKTKKRQLHFILTTNGIALTKDKIKYLKNNGFLVECSLDGPLSQQLTARKSLSGKNYFKSMIKNYAKLLDSGVNNYAIGVIRPENIERSFDNLSYLAKVGFKSIQANYELGTFWTEKAVLKLFSGMTTMAHEFKGHGIEFINSTRNRREPVVLNAEITADVDGGLYSEYGICLEEDFGKMKRQFGLGSLNRIGDINPLYSTPFENFLKLSRAYNKQDGRFKRIILNNIFLGIKMGDFLKGSA